MYAGTLQDIFVVLVKFSNIFFSEASILVQDSMPLVALLETIIMYLLLKRAALESC